MAALAHAVPSDSSPPARRPVVTSKDWRGGARSSHQRAVYLVTLRARGRDDTVTHDRAGTPERVPSLSVSSDADEYGPQPRSGQADLRAGVFELGLGGLGGVLRDALEDRLRG